MGQAKHHTSKGPTPRPPKSTTRRAAEIRPHEPLPRFMITTRPYTKHEASPRIDERRRRERKEFLRYPHTYGAKKAAFTGVLGVQDMGWDGMVWMAWLSMAWHCVALRCKYWSIQLYIGRGLPSPPQTDRKWSGNKVDVIDYCIPAPLSSFSQCSSLVATMEENEKSLVSLVTSSFL